MSWGVGKQVRLRLGLEPRVPVMVVMGGQADGLCAGLRAPLPFSHTCGCVCFSEQETLIERVFSHTHPPTPLPVLWWDVMGSLCG